MKKNNFILILILTLIVSCNSENNKSYEDFFNKRPVSKKNIQLNSIAIDTVYLPKIESSYVGNTITYQDSIFFIDARFAWIFVFDKNGNFITKHLGQGRGPHEIPIKAIDASCFLPNGNKLFIGSPLDIFIFDNTYKKEKRVTMYKFLRDPKEVKPENPNIYTFDYENFVVKYDSKGYIYAPIYAEQESFNPFSSYKYYKEGRILMKINYKTGEIIDIMGRRSPEYLKYHYLGHHAFFYYDIDHNNNFYINHEIDSLIYVYNSSFDLIKAFGYAGRHMDTNYTELSRLDVNKYRDLFFNDRPKRGYYSGIKVFSEQGILFRCYKKGAKENKDGLQIYKGNTLVADIDVPKGFIVDGYIAPYFYTKAIVDDINEKIKLYRFKLNPKILAQ